MLLFDVINLLNDEITPERTKLHLASWNGEENPLDVYYDGKFNDWQCWQSKKNFERDFVVSLIDLDKSGNWLFAGTYQRSSVRWHPKKWDRGFYRYRLIEDGMCKELSGRLVVSFQRTSRQSYRRAETLADQITVAEIYREPLTVGDFPGYRNVNLSRNHLALIVNQSLVSWRTALSNVAGIYLISDEKSGGLYVGAAYGGQGIWQRWSNYVATKDGGNVELKKLLKSNNKNYVENFKYSILEVLDINLSEAEVRAREAHWKNVLLSRQPHGLNAN